MEANLPSLRVIDCLGDDALSDMKRASNSASSLLWNVRIAEAPGHLWLPSTYMTGPISSVQSWNGIQAVSMLSEVHVPQ